MSNRFFNFLSRFVAGTKVRAEQANARFDDLEAGLDDVASELDSLNLAVGTGKAAVSLASAATTLISTAASMNVNLTGVATITAFDTMADGTLRYVTAAGAFTLTHHATALILPGAANIVAAAGDSFILKSLGSGNWRVIDYTRASGKAVKGSAVDIPASASGNLAGVNVEQQLQELDVEKAKAAGDATQDFAAKNLSVAGILNESKGTDIASATTLDLDAATGNLVDVTGTTTITAITLSAGRERTVRFTGALTLTHGASLVLPGEANIATAAGTIAIFRGGAGGVVYCVACSSQLGQGGRLVDVQYFFVAGADTWTKPANLTANAFAIIVTQGAGGGSVGATSSASQCSISAAGGAGGYALTKMDASLLSATEPVSVGAGSSGANGGATTFGTLGVSRINAGGGLVNNSTLATGTSVAAAPRNGYGGACTAAAGEMLESKVGSTGVNGLRLSGSSAIVPMGGDAPLSGPHIGDIDTSVSSYANAVNGWRGSGASGAISINGNPASGASGGDGFVVVYTYD